MKTNKGLYEVGIKMRETRPDVKWSTIEKSIEFAIACDNNDVEEYQKEYIRRGFLNLPFEEEKQCGIITIRGKFEGHKIEDVPIAYLKWCLKSSVIKTKPELEKQIKEYLDNHE